jgi:type VI protein secretion system component VasK
VWNHIKRWWAIYGHVSKFRNLLQWIGVWKPLVALLTALAVWAWGLLKGLAGPELFVLALTTFAMVLVIALIVFMAIEHIRMKKQITIQPLGASMELHAGHLETKLHPAPGLLPRLRRLRNRLGRMLHISSPR